MRVAIQPLISARVLDGESNYLWWKKVILAGRERFPHFLCYLILPEECRETYEKKPLGDFVRPIFEKVRVDFYTQENVSNGEISGLFSARCGDWPIDLFCTSRAIAGASFVAALRDFKRVPQIPVFMYEPAVKQTDMFEHGYDPWYPFLKVVSYALCHTVYLSQYEYEMAVGWAQKFLSPAMVAKLIENAKVINPSLTTEKISVPQEKKAHDPFTLFFGARFNANKNIRSIVSIYDGFYKTSGNVRIVMSSPNDIKGYVKHLLEGYPHIEVHNKCKKAEFLSLLPQADVFVCASTLEGYPVGFLEMMLHGIIGVIVKEDWAVKVFGEDYPFYFNNELEAHSLLKYIKNNYEQAYQKFRVYVEKNLVDKIAGRDFANEVWDFAEKSIELAPPLDTMIPGGIGELIREFGRTRLKFNLVDVIKYCQTHSQFKSWNTYKYPFQGIPTILTIHRILTRQMGLVDLCDNEMPTYTKADLIGEI